MPEIMILAAGIRAPTNKRTNASDGKCISQRSHFCGEARQFVLFVSRLGCCRVCSKGHSLLVGFYVLLSTLHLTFLADGNMLLWELFLQLDLLNLGNRVIYNVVYLAYKTDPKTILYHLEHFFTKILT